MPPGSDSGRIDPRTLNPCGMFGTVRPENATDIGNGVISRKPDDPLPGGTAPPAILVGSWPGDGFWSTALVRTSPGEMVCFMVSAPLPDEPPLILGFRVADNALAVEMAVRADQPPTGSHITIAVDGAVLARGPVSGALSARGYTTILAAVPPADTATVLRRLETGRSVSVFSGSVAVSLSLGGSQRALVDLRTCAEFVRRTFGSAPMTAASAVLSRGSAEPPAVAIDG